MSHSRGSLLVALVLVLSCKAGAQPESADAESSRPSNAWPENDGIRLAEASRPYVEVEKVGSGEQGVTVRAPARVVFRDTAISRVGAPIASRVMKLHVQVGDKVKTNDVLATLASPGASDYHAELARARVELGSATGVLKRQEEMIAKGVGREYERAMAEVQVRDAEERVRAAKRNVALLGKSFGGTVIVTSQIEGTVLRRNASVGAQVDPDGEPLFEIGNPKDLWVVADVFQDDLEMLREGAAVTVQIASQAEPRTGTVESIGVLLDTAVRRAPVYISLKERDAKDLKAGMFARAIIESDASDTITLPVGAVLIKNGDRTIVYVERDDGTFAAQEVQLGHMFGERVEVISGVSAGTKVAIKGALLLDGAANQLL
ncbi:MAG: efflux RND transporter periplasmic adaptor subunit [Deltaproteobacteria bacterium]|nr:efflux RND transporter periplasmic adaptor subunit [Nannocystaceae bacterium]